MAGFHRFIYVVSQDRPDLYEMLRAEFAWQSDVAIVLDRRRAKRHLQPELDAELDVVGYFVTVCGRVALVDVS